MSSTTEKSFIDKLFAAGSHFGFKKSRRHPTVAPYLYTTKDGNDIFDLTKTAELLENAKEALKDAGLHGKTISLRRHQGRSFESRHCSGGKNEAAIRYQPLDWWNVTNFPEIKKRIARLEALQHEKETGELERKYTKKERVVIGREIEQTKFQFCWYFYPREDARPTSNR